MKKIIVLISSVFFFITSCNNHHKANTVKEPESAYLIEGNITGLDSGWLYLERIDITRKEPLTIFDSAKILNSHFQFAGKLVKLEPCKISLKNQEHVWPDTHYFILDTGFTKGQLYKDSMANSIITGGKSQEQFTDFNKKLFDLEIARDKKYSEYKKEGKPNDSLDELFNRFAFAKYDLVLKEMKEYPQSLVSPYLAYRNISDDIEMPTLEDIYNSIENKNNYYSRLILNTINARKNASVGVVAPDFKIVDNKNRTLTNETFKGKYFLLDFWANWCVPCREESPYLVKANKKYAHQGFEIISISVDRNKKAWEAAVKKDRMTWIQVLDFKNEKSQVADIFNFKTIPTNYLVDKDGKIIGKNLRGTDLEKVLEKRLGKN